MAFWQLTIPVSSDTSEALTNFLWEQGALGVIEEESPGAPPRLRAFFTGTASSPALLAAVDGYRASLRSLGFAVDPAPAEVAPLREEAWASAWQQSFPIRPVGRRLLVVPPWQESNGAAGRLLVIIEPGRAFGTGHHGTTEGCLILLEDALATMSPPSVLDIGTGTGILAIAAVKLGASAVRAIDVDPDAVAAARSNAARNGCADRIVAQLQGPEQVAARFLLVLANLLTHAHLALASQYARLVRPGGRLVLGGMLEGDDGRVVEALAGAGFTLRSRLAREGWVSLRVDASPS